MNETEKPFACSEKDCEMTFTNEDHLNWHQKKHDMILNLGLAKNDVADQTPTPTRFIRNCEEVGLFQDLQNVNPFDEIFKKAAELAKNGGTLEVPEANSDDTLHTPHILPHIEESRKKINNVSSNRDDNNSRSNEFSLNSVIPMENICTSESNEKQRVNTPIIIDDDSSNEDDVKMKIKKALQTKEKQKREKDNSPNSVRTNVISVVNISSLTVEKEKLINIKNANKDTVIDENREKIREMNRAAQIRCRKRKQIRWKEMEKEIKLLREENKKLKLENYSLQCQMIQIKKVLDNNKESSVPPVVQHIIPKVNNSAPNPIVIELLPDPSNTPVLTTEGSLSNIKIERMCNVAKIVTNGNSEYMPKMKKSLRKIIPKIVIEN